MGLFGAPQAMMEFRDDLMSSGSEDQSQAGCCRGLLVIAEIVLPYSSYSYSIIYLKHSSKKLVIPWACINMNASHVYIYIYTYVDLFVRISLITEF